MGWIEHNLSPKLRQRIAEAEAKQSMGDGPTHTVKLGFCLPPGGAPVRIQVAHQSLESDLHDFILDHAHSRGWLCVHSRMDRPTTTAVGVSDFVLITPKTVMFIECKRPGAKATPKQQAFLMAVRCLGWPEAIVHTQEEYLRFVEGK